MVFILPVKVKHQTKKGESVCQICDVGRFKKVQSFEGDTIDYDCITCPHGRTSKTGASVCSTCSTGRMKVGDDANSFTMTMDPIQKMCVDPISNKPRMEKYTLRKAFDTPEDPYLPNEVLWRQKEQFSDGVGYTWIDSLDIH